MARLRATPFETWRRFRGNLQSSTNSVRQVFPVEKCPESAHVVVLQRCKKSWCHVLPSSRYLHNILKLAKKKEPANHWGRRRGDGVSQRQSWHENRAAAKKKTMRAKHVNETVLNAAARRVERVRESRGAVGDIRDEPPDQKVDPIRVEKFLDHHGCQARAATGGKVTGGRIVLLEAEYSRRVQAQSLSM